MPAQSHARLLVRAAEILGGEQALQAFLRVAPGQLERWMQGRSTLPADLFLKLVDLLGRHEAAALAQPCNRFEAMAARLKKMQSLQQRTAKQLEAAHATLAKSNQVRDWSIALRAARLVDRERDAAPALKHQLFAPNFMPRDRAELLETALDATLEVAGTDLGNVQLIDTDAALRIETHRGFEKPFLEFFSVVSQPECACGVAMSVGRQVFIPDVRRNSMFMGTDAGKVLESAGVRAVTSSPLVHASGLVLGMISTHYRKPCAEHQTLASLDLVARRAASWLDVSTGV